jgi:hypothetical protein
MERALGKPRTHAVNQINTPNGFDEICMETTLNSNPNPNDPFLQTKCAGRLRPSIRGIFFRGVSMTWNSAEFSSVECPGRKIQRNFLPWSVRDEKFNGIFFHGVSGAKNSAEFSFTEKLSV